MRVTTPDRHLKVLGFLLAGMLICDTCMPDDSFLKTVRPILASHCASCHCGDEPAAGVDVTSLIDGAKARQSRRLWRRVVTQLETGAMPPSHADPLPAAERQKLLRWMKDTLNQPSSGDRDPGPTLVRRLSRPEYERTMRDLLGFDCAVAEAVGLADESQGHGFANRAAVLDLSPVLLEKYFAAADIVLDRLLAAPDEEHGPDDRVRIGPRRTTPAGAIHGPLVVESKCAGTKADDNQVRPHFRIRNSGKSAVPLQELTLRYWFTADAASEFQQWCDYARLGARNVTCAVTRLDAPVANADAYLEVGFAEGVLEPGGETGEIQMRIAQHDWAAFDQTNDYSFDPHRTDFTEATQVTLYRSGALIWGTEPSGPPTVASDVKALIPFDPDTVRAKKNLLGPGTDPRLSEAQAARRIITAFACRAWRRPVRDEEVEMLMSVRDRAAAHGANFCAAIRPALKAILVSPHFLFRVEADGSARAAESFRRVTGHELAVRLSYFLWSSMPDDELLRAAEKGRLSEPSEYEAQVRRMLADPKARALTDNFVGPWVQLGKLQTSRPTEEFFPGYTPAIRMAMVQETVLFFEHMRLEDRSLIDVIDCDYTFVNEDLARHYGLPGVEGGEMRRVSLRPEDHRGGILGMGSMLTSTSHTYRTSPTLRGKYVLEVLLGAPPPPPPANVGVLKDEARGKAPRNFRESLSQHAGVAACAACHSRIDPLGFGLEQYDGVGRWRGGDVAVLDASGELPDGTAFSGPAELKRLLMRRRDQFLRNVGEQMLTYALGRPLEDCDDDALACVESALHEDEPRFSTLVVAVATSFPFQHRRVRR